MVRVSGPGVRTWADKVAPELRTERSWQAQLVHIRDAGGEELERGIAIPYAAPRSYTGEDMVELVLHGSRYLVEQVIAASQAAGCRCAEPGEFTRRAVANGKMDLVQAEAVNDLIRAETAVQARNARRQLQGRLSSRLRELRDLIVGLRARVEASIDFVAQGIEPELEDMEARRAEIERGVEELLRSAEEGERIRDGVRIVIAGETNAGKSTLFNALLRRERAIVDANPGTTRDLLEAELDIGGHRVVLVDTAGMREGESEVELEGMRRAQAAIAEASGLLLVWPVDSRQEEPRLEGLEWTLRLRTKADLDEAVREEGEWLPISVLNGMNLHVLSERVQAAVAGDRGGDESEVAIGRRHREKLGRAVSEVRSCDLSDAEIAAEALRWAAREMEELTGEIQDQEVLDEVFREFCLGK